MSNDVTHNIFLLQTKVALGFENKILNKSIKHNIK
jgi:hypothetical protein